MAEEQIKPRGSRFKNISGQRFGRLTIVAVAEARTFESGKIHWNCLCDCGKTTIVPRSNITNLHTQSCGCFHSERTSETHLKHGMSDTREYHAWRAAIARCTNRDHPEYRRYGARGIFMCDRWMDSVEAFIADMGPCPDGLTLDRKDNDGPYSPDNCHWTTPAAQTRNRRITINITHNGETLCLKDWSRKAGIAYSTLRERYEKGHPLFTPIDRRYSR